MVPNPDPKQYWNNWKNDMSFFSAANQERPYKQLLRNWIIQSYQFEHTLTGCWLVWMRVVICDCPFGAVTDTVPGSLACTSILYSGGRKVLNPTISSECPLKSDDTLLMASGASILENNNKKKNVRQKLYKTIRKWDLFHFLTPFCKFCWNWWKLLHISLVTEKNSRGERWGVKALHGLG